MATPAPRRRPGCGVIALSVIGVLILIGIVAVVTNGTGTRPGPSSGGSVATGGATNTEPTPTATQTPSGPATAIGQGTYVVGSDIVAGTYKTAGPTGDLPCYWARLKNTSGDFSAIITNGNPTGQTTVTISKTDGAFETTGCQQWTKVG